MITPRNLEGIIIKHINFWNSTKYYWILF